MIDLWIIAAALVIAFICGIIGGMVGGSYLVFIPALLFLGWDVHEVIAITKLVTIAAGLAFVKYMKNGKVDAKFSWPYVLVLVVGSVVGSLIVINLESELLTTLIAVFMLIVAGFMIWKKDFGVNPVKIMLRKRHKIIALVCFLFAGVYLGIYGAAASIIYIVLFTTLLKKDFVTSIGNARFVDFFGGIAGAIVFAWQGLIDYTIALPIAVVYFIGAWQGATITLKKGSAWVRYLIIVLAIVFAVKLLFF